MSYIERIINKSIEGLRYKSDYLLRCEFRDLNFEVELGSGLLKDNLTRNGIKEEYYNDVLIGVLDAYTEEIKIREIITKHL